MATRLGLWQSRMAPDRPVRVPSSEESGAPGAAPGAGGRGPGRRLLRVVTVALSRSSVTEAGEVFASHSGAPPSQVFGTGGRPSESRSFIRDRAAFVRFSSCLVSYTITTEVVVAFDADCS